MAESDKSVVGCAINRRQSLSMEEWESQAALDRHLISSAYKALVAAIELSTRPPAIRFDSVAQHAGIEVMEAACGVRGGA